LFFQFKPEVAERMMEHPNDRQAAAARVVEAVGGKLEAYYWMTGPHDGFVITEVSGTLSAAAISLAVGSTGVFAHLETHELIPATEVNKLLERAKQARAAYTPPGAG
jgi:uncharacterized protein with GYD domain